MNSHFLSRRCFCRIAASAVLASRFTERLLSASAASRGDFKLNYILASSMYGNLPLAEIVPEVRKTGAEVIDIWPKPHGNQREEIEEMGHERFLALLEANRVQVGIYTCYNPGVMASAQWMRTVKRFGGRMIVAGAGGPKGVTGEDLKRAVRGFAEKIRPQIALAQELGVKIALENHGGSLIEAPEAILMLMDAIASDQVGIALAPYHLPQDSERLARLIRDLGPRLLHFYAWEHGEGSSKKLPKVREMKQMPGYGPLDFRPLVSALKQINYQGWTSIFMHPVPRGIPILPLANEVTQAINRSREYLESCVGG